MRPPMRSSIACLRCRRSKIKCDNDGGNSPCETCIKSGHKCQYPEAPVLTPKRGEPGGIRLEGGNDRKRAKRIEDVPGFDSERAITYAEEVLAYPFLTDEVWDQVLTIYRLHFATELPFLHLPTLKEKMSRRHGKDPDPSSELNLVLLGILTLTARFHPDLVKYIAHMGPPGGGSRTRPVQPKFDPPAASEFFANALTAALGPLKTAMTLVSVERVQALLMLAVFEWSQRSPYSGTGAWMYVGLAIRLAQSLRLSFDDKICRIREIGGGRQGGSSRGLSEIGIIREIRRRTMFSCLMLERLFACGTERSSLLRSEDIQIQLPCSEMAFDLALDVHTGYLRPSPEARQRPINDDSVLSRFVQLVDIWGSIAKYSTTGGRLREQYAPWDERSTFRRLREDLDRFVLSLPDTFTLSRSNYYRHENHQATNTYVSLHVLAALCQIVLDREYLPFLPIRCGGPQGPLDPRLGFNTQAAGSFWEEGAENVFRAARDIVDIVEITREKLPHSTLISFAIWMASFFGIYAQHFPHMDMKRHMASQDDVDRRALGDPDLVKMSTTGVTIPTLCRMVGFLQGADHYVKHCQMMDHYFTRARAETEQYNDNTRSPSVSISRERRLSIRLGDERPGTEEWRPPPSTSRMPRDPRDPAIIPENEQHPRAPYSPSDPSRSSHERRSSMGVSEGFPPNTDYSRTPRSTPSMSFTAINNPAGASLPSMSSESLPSILESPRAALMAANPRAAPASRSSAGQSQLDLPGYFPEFEGAQGMPDFSLDQFGNLESQRLAKMLNDLQELAGTGSLGGFSWNDLDAEERPYAGA